MKTTSGENHNMKKIYTWIGFVILLLFLVACQEEILPEVEPLGQPTNLRVESGYLMWDSVDFATNGYVLSVNNQLSEHLTNLVDMNAQSIKEHLNVGENAIKVQAKAVSLYKESLFSEVFTYTHVIFPNAVSITGPSTLYMNAEATYLASVLPVLASQEVIWHSSNESVATIDSDGKLLAVGLGDTIITATVKDTEIQDQISVTILQALASSVEVTGPDSLMVGEEILLSASVFPLGSKQQVFWSIDDTTKASISTQGRLVALSAGTVTVKATSFDSVTIYGIYEIEILFAQPTSVSITPIHGVLIDQSVSMTAYVNPITASQDILWTSSDPLIASINDLGVITGHQAGDVVISAYAKNHSSIVATINLSVTNMKVDRIVIYEGISQMTNTESFDFKATVYPLIASQRIVWSVSDETKATISASGKVTPVAGATGIVSVKAQSLSDSSIFGTYSLQIIDSASSITLVSNYLELVQAVNGSATYIKLTNHIDASGMTFVPSRTNFTGIFDGNGYAISNLKITSTQADAGLFRRIGGHAVIKDVTFIDPQISSNSQNTGLIAGQINSQGQVTIQNVVVLGLQTTMTSAQFTHGGFIAQITAASTVSIQRSQIDYLFKSSVNTGNVGGFIGVVNNNSNATVHISNSIVDFKVDATASGQIYGGVIGQINNATSSSIHQVYVRIRNVGSQNALVNGGLIYSQINSSGDKHYISRIIYAQGTSSTRAFINNNGASKVNGALVNTDLLLTSEIMELNASTALLFTQNHPVWIYNAQDSKLEFDLSYLEEINEAKLADELIAIVTIGSSSTVTSDITLASDIQDYPLVWESSHPNVLSTEGVVNRQEADVLVSMTVTLTVGSQVRTKSFEVTVSRVIDETEPIELTVQGVSTIRANQTHTFTATVLPSNIPSEVLWTITFGEEHASINSNGVLTALSSGIAIVKATLVYNSEIIFEYEVEVLEALLLDASVVGDGLAINTPSESVVSVTTNTAGTLYYLQSVDTLTAAQILASGSKKSVVIAEAGNQNIEVTITSGTRLLFVMQTENMEVSHVKSLTFDLKLSFVMVSNYTELVSALNQTANINIKLNADIYATGTFTPTKTNPFTGIFDGQGFTIHNMALVSNGNHIGLFREIGGNATIKNIKFNEPTISTAHFASGLIAGRVSSAGLVSIENISIKGLVTTVTQSQWTHGGLIGTVNVNGTHVQITNVYMDYTIRTTSTSVSTGNAGALIGTHFNTSTVSVSHAQIDMKVSFANTGNTGQILGAVIGQTNAGTTTNVSFVAASIKNIGAANAISNAGIVFSQMNNAGSNHLVQSILVVEGSQVSKLTNNYGTSINGATSATHANITQQFHTVLNETIGLKFVDGNSLVWVYNSSSNQLEHQGKLA